MLCAAAARCDGHGKDLLAAGLQACGILSALPAPAHPWIHPGRPGSCPCRTTIQCCPDPELVALLRQKDFSGFVVVFPDVAVD